MKVSADKLRLYGILGGVGDDDMRMTMAEQSMRGGIDILQLREKNLSQDEYVRRARLLLPLCQKYAVPLIINDDLDVCLESGADGVHLGQSDDSLLRAKQLLSAQKIIGATAHNLSEAIRAQSQGADYLGVGAAFGSRTKLDAVPIDHDEYRRITSVLDIPVVAIGGIHLGNAPLLKDSGISGIAVISAIFSQEDIQAAAKQLKERCLELFDTNKVAMKGALS